MSLYDLVSRYYDLEYGDFEDDLPLYIDLARRSGPPILDLGTGTGRVAIALARAGFRVTGVDESVAMLERAQTKSRREATLAKGLELVQKAIPGFDGEGRYGLAIMALGTFAHFSTKRQQLDALIATRRSLRPNGLLVIDLASPHLIDLSQNETLLALHWEKTDPETGHFVQKWLTYRLDPTQQIQHYTLIYDEIKADGTIHRTRILLPIRYTGRFEGELLLERAGFSVENVYGSYDLTPYRSDSERMIFVAVAK